MFLFVSLNSIIFLSFAFHDFHIMLVFYVVYFNLHIHDGSVKFINIHDFNEVLLIYSTLY